MSNLLKNLFISGVHRLHVAHLHTTSPSFAWAKANVPCKFLADNKIIYPPQGSGETRRPSFVCHQKTNIKYSPDKLWYIACFVRGMTVDEAVKQLSFVSKKGAGFVKEALLEAQEMAVNQHHVEFKSNLWISQSFCGKGFVIKGVRRHARRRMGEVRYQYSHYFVRLEEGKPPQDYYKTNPLTPEQQLQNWIDQMRKRKIVNSY